VSRAGGTVHSGSAPIAAALFMSALPRYLYAFVAISGMSGLIYEVVWMRALGLHFGTSTPAVTTVLAAFMAGLGLGNVWLGRRADRVTRPLLLYARIEGGIAIFGLAVSLLALNAGVLLDAASRLSSGLGAASAIARALVLAFFMLVPCTLMGGTLPVLSRALVRRGHSGRTLGSLYALNTFGALAGALLPDFWLIPQRGLLFTACFAAAGNAVIAVVLGRTRSLREEAPVAPARTEELSGQAVPVTAWLLTGLSGFSAMSLEVLWARTLAHWADGVVTSFALLLAVYLSTLSLGAVLTRVHADKTARPLRIAAALLTLAGVFALAPIVFAPWWRNFELHLVTRGPGLIRPGIGYIATNALLHSMYLESIACLLMGAAFPYVAAAVVREGSAGAGTGRLFTINTIAGMAGALVSGFMWLPSLGEQGSYFAAAFVLTVGSSVFVFRGESGRAVRALSYLAAGCVVLVVVTVAWLPADQLVRAHFRGRSRIVALREGSTTTAAATEGRAYGQPYFLELATPGVSMSDTSFPARRYMGMMAHTAMLAARTPQRALLICYGVGNTASSLLSYPQLERLDIVDIAQEVIELAPTFAKMRGSDPLRDPRTRVFIDDGRHHLIGDDQGYDAITLEPPPPNHAGVANLYSREFYQLAKSRLRAGGVMTQWLPVFQLSESDSMQMIAAFVAEFPHAALLYGYSKHFILVGSREPLAIDASEALRRLAAPQTAEDLRQSGISGVADIYGSVLQDDRELRRLVRGSSPVSDDRPSIQYSFAAIAAWPNYARWLLHTPSRPGALLATEPEPVLRTQIDAVAMAISRVIGVLHLSETGSAERRELVMGNAVRSALSARPNDEALLALLSLHFERVRLAHQVFDRTGTPAMLKAGASAALARGMIANYQAAYDAAWTLGRRAFYTSDYARALEILSSFEPQPDQAARHALLRAGCLRALDRPREAAIAFDNAISTSHDPSFQASLRDLVRSIARPFPPDFGPLASR
jgi:spermidine synthase